MTAIKPKLLTTLKFKLYNRSEASRRPRDLLYPIKYVSIYIFFRIQFLLNKF